jgi:hypothetical protein
LNYYYLVEKVKDAPEYEFHAITAIQKDRRICNGLREVEVTPRRKPVREITPRNYSREKVMLE